jgi:hypothetical protein|tara:strand:+ start:949 stop:1230 length:282 start_codon:yes stop_codon:yes gene_type:complete
MDLITIILLSVLGVSNLVFIYTTFNSLKKNEKMEDIILNYDNFIKEYGKQINITQDKLNQIDAKGTFRSDDEIGWFFSQIKRLQDDLSRFKPN